MIENSAYAILGIPKSSTEKEVKAAYVNLVKKYDPEKHTERFMVIQQAYDRLRQVKSRAKEDILSFNMAQGEYLFQEDEKWRDPEPPDDEMVNKVRRDYLAHIMNDDLKSALLRVLFSRAHYLVTRKLLGEAIRDWSEVLEHEPSHARARHNLELACSNLGISYALHGLNEEAIELLERALKMDPDSTEIIHNLAILSERCRDSVRTVRYWEEVMARWKRQLERDPTNDYMRFLLTEALGHQEDISDLIASAPRRSAAQVRVSQPVPVASSAAVPKLGPPAPRPTGGSSTAVPKLAAPGPPAPPTASASIERNRDIVKLNPDDFDAHFQLCNKLMEEKLFAEAREELQILTRKHPKNTDVWNLLGWAMLNSGQKDEAFNCWKRSMSIDPKNPTTREHLVKAHLNMGKAFRSKGIFTQALVHFKQLLALMPKSAEVHLEIAATYDMKGDVRSALAEYQQVLTLDPKNQVAKKAITDLRMKR